MSDYYRAKVLSHRKLGGIDGLDEALFDCSYADFGFFAKKPPKQKEIRKAVKAAGAKDGPAVLYSHLDFHLSKRVFDLAKAKRILERELADAAVQRKDPKKISPRADTMNAARLWFFYGFLADVFPSVKPFPALAVQVQVAQHHPDAPPPYKDKNPIIARERLRAFSMRLLTEAYGGADAYQSSPIYEYYGEDAWLKSDGRPVVLGARVVDYLPIKDAPAFWKKHARTWWAKDETFRSLSSGGGGDPLHVATYEIVVHPSWMPKVTKQVFDSRAY